MDVSRLKKRKLDYAAGLQAESNGAESKEAEQQPFVFKFESELVKRSLWDYECVCVLS